MQKLFNKIIVPVDFTSRSRSAIEKAIEIAKQYNCSIHLLHVITVPAFAAVAMAEGHLSIPYNMVDNKPELEEQLKKLSRYISFISDNSIKAEYSIQKGTWDEVIIDMVNQGNYDLLLIGQKGSIIRKRKMMINPDKIAGRTNIPVITVPSNRRMTKLYSIVIPITDFLPVRKLMYGVYIAANHDTTVKLLGVENEHTKEKVQYYIDKARQVIRDNCDVRVETETIVSENVAEAVNQFAMQQAADLVILNPGTQTKMPGFFSSLLGNVIQKYSVPPVLTVSPA